MGSPGFSSFTAEPDPDPPVPSPVFPLGMPWCSGRPARGMFETSSVSGSGGDCGGTRSLHPAAPTPAAATTTPSHPRMRIRPASLLFGT
jgi:hypothetical protein